MFTTSNELLFTVGRVCCVDSKDDAESRVAVLLPSVVFGLLSQVSHSRDSFMTHEAGAEQAAQM